jgi:16S rRNA U516 pseudouridylate synthase RsuA-like enzyme
VVSLEADAEGLEVLTTSQKLAHRIVHELRKVFRGRATYAWSDRDGSLYATWRRER